MLRARREKEASAKVKFKETSLENDYSVQGEIGSGQFAVVRRCVQRSSGDHVAAKFIKKKVSNSSRRGLFRIDIVREVQILRKLDNEHIMKIYDVYEDRARIVLIVELVSGGELFDYLSERETLTEPETACIVKQILQATAYLHSKKVAHLDLKPENIMLLDKDSKTPKIKIIDFGLSQVIKPGQPCQAVHGTPEFVAPEVLAYEPVSFPADIWSIGIITYILLSGCSPFLGDDKSETFDRILDLDYDFDDEIFADVSNDAKNFIADILQRHPRSRPSAKKCLKMDWVNLSDDEDKVDVKQAMLETPDLPSEISTSPISTLNMDSVGPTPEPFLDTDDNLNPPSIEEPKAGMGFATITPQTEKVESEPQDNYGIFSPAEPEVGLTVPDAVSRHSSGSDDFKSAQSEEVEPPKIPRSLENSSTEAKPELFQQKVPDNHQPDTPTKSNDNTDLPLKENHKEKETDNRSESGSRSSGGFRTSPVRLVPNSNSISKTSLSNKSRSSSNASSKGSFGFTTIEPKIRIEPPKSDEEVENQAYDRRSESPRSRSDSDSGEEAENEEPRPSSVNDVRDKETGPDPDQSPEQPTEAPSPKPIEITCPKVKVHQKRFMSLIPNIKGNQKNLYATHRRMVEDLELIFTENPLYKKLKKFLQPEFVELPGTPEPPTCKSDSELMNVESAVNSDCDPDETENSLSSSQRTLNKDDPNKQSMTSLLSKTSKTSNNVLLNHQVIRNELSSYETDLAIFRKKFRDQASKNRKKARQFCEKLNAARLDERITDRGILLDKLMAETKKELSEQNSLLEACRERRKTHEIEKAQTEKSLGFLTSGPGLTRSKSEIKKASISSSTTADSNISSQGPTPSDSEVGSVDLGSVSATSEGSSQGISLSDECIEAEDRALQL